MSAATRSSRGNSDNHYPNVAPLRQAIVLIACHCGKTHPLLVSSPDEEELDALVDFLCRDLQHQGITVTSRITTSWNAVSDLDMRNPGFTQMCARMKAQAEDAGVYTQHEEGELPF